MLFMPKKIKIAITQRIDFIESYNEYRNSLDIKLIDMLSYINFMSFIIPNGLNLKDLIIWLNQVKPDGILLSGGNNIGEFAIRDNVEIGVYQWAVEKGKPIFGICRGMQFINYINGGKLKQVENHVSIKHDIYTLPESSIIKRHSFHQLALCKCPKDFIVTHLSPDDIIEGIEHKEHKIKGIMWHPEREHTFEEYDLKLIQAFYEQR
jgi:N5-(cytidine 5'-diphosphoramidyl)-L-glutamine hydrolase